jgi:hypothetical protein
LRQPTSLIVLFAALRVKLPENILFSIGTGQASKPDGIRLWAGAFWQKQSSINKIRDLINSPNQIDIERIISDSSGRERESVDNGSIQTELRSPIFSLDLVLEVL